MVTSFEGFLDSYELWDGDVELRFVSGGFDPLPTEPPVLKVYVHNAQKLKELQAILESIDDSTYVESLSPTELTVHAGHEEPLCIRGESVSLRFEQYGPRDYERLAKINHEWGQSQYNSLTKAIRKLSESESLLIEQTRRLELKLQHYAPGSTARVLYQKHLSFLARLYDVIKA